MTYVITYGPLGMAREVSCETAVEALETLTELAQKGEPGVMVSSFQTEAEAMDALRVLAARERSPDER
ncbi:hypothetical protein [Chenggangzhangella methanolivorans]|uniref:Uncharacterized protein n=1 Tax=Chenggangzhangella methanolivorans TaxID=1437009 RepID=A0A9E6ULC6_9HYPH|nr:hypothetical protein [Chenggangzhangella methanolivorans]QZN98785.1 hypothetical protein K6K41_17730 [Chenggangzhangella methanolivorans]